MMSWFVGVTVQAVLVGLAAVCRLALTMTAAGFPPTGRLIAQLAQPMQLTLR
jgi:hypothetical protein